ncbi:hypothetical protein [Castellaniella sp.]|uniref:hypothetical protein n=1 Tax=Castellaniella sp. TaxID=1955812 RepID=UPI002AFFD244|nr:hypothetical protein [Castellaniella sp.]
MPSALDFGFYFDRVLHFYGGLSYRELLSLPIRTFWRLSNNINRIRAETDIRSFHIALASQSRQAHEFKDSLVIEMGEPTTVDPIASAIPDKDAIAQLKQLMGQG